MRRSSDPCFVADTMASMGVKLLSVTKSSMSFAYSPWGHQTKP